LSDKLIEIQGKTKKQEGQADTNTTPVTERSRHGTLWPRYDEEADAP
jgi:hypothetical protein